MILNIESSITQKGHGTYLHILEGADFMHLYVVEEIRVFRENHSSWIGDYYPATCLGPDSNPDHRVGELSHEKTGLLPMRKQSRRSASHLQRLCFHNIDSTFPLLPKPKFLRF